MKLAAHLVFAAIAAASAHAGYGGGVPSTAASNDTDSGSDSGCPSMCPALHAPVCGSDGVTYSNACRLSVANCNSQSGAITQVHDGACSTSGSTSETSSYETSTDNSESDSCSKACTKIYMPVCGSDGVTYGNDCMFGVAQCKSGGTITKVSDGQCPESSTSSTGSTGTDCPDECIEIWKPVCGSDGVTYANSCFLGVATCKDPSVTQASDGACTYTSSGCPEVCTAIYSPVCGSDGVTYGNECELGVASCKNPKQNIKKVEASSASSSTSCPDACTAIYAPVCGSDGVTYSSECKLDVACCKNPELHITKAHDGACSVECKTQL
ncbi:Kazal-like serine protease inhibitor domain-containing protein [Phytophthora sojae]|uniref:Kazal-like serine protease inhibitor domain-containing protein n=1 Tax=Phytophthora sojae (strain P6497) TaxID=1094619 RepID=G4Z0L2_PHYSP|nr:Kazal-like serine protease inhibitor domain-containing protein [Phytophthora sojae]EGZ25861.1 Kazal-like serine protease inhibitor domain-containing protein [Phytophthora sojae]|eukprot:XP_009521149.1 Kazal-like serine protease inhibitor domain-containing protein [Phytophthora sojae]